MSGESGIASGDRSSGLTAVVAMTPSGVIGLNGDMPWRLSSDLRRFKRLTTGGVLMMGRRTFDSIGRPLPDRKTVVITRNPDWSASGVEHAGSPAEAVDVALRLAAENSGAPHGAGTGRVFVVGGAEIYRELFPKCTDLYLTRVWSSVEGDTKLEIDLSEYRIIEQTRHPATARDDVPSEFLRLIRQES